MKNNETKQSIKILPELSKNRINTPYAGLKELLQWKNISVEERVEDLCDFLLNWSLNDNATNLRKGIFEYGMPYETYIEWLKTSIHLQKIVNEVKFRIGIHLLDKSEQKDNVTMQKRIHLYDEDMAASLNQERDFKREMAKIKTASTEKLIQSLQFVGTEVKKTEVVDNAIKRSRKDNNKTK